MTRAKFETEKILERTGQTLSPFAGGHARERSVVEKDGTGRWFVHFCQQFDERRFSCAILADNGDRSEEHTSELQSQSNLVCRLLLEKKKKTARRCTLTPPPGASTSPAPITTEFYGSSSA